MLCSEVTHKSTGLCFNNCKTSYSHVRFRVFHAIVLQKTRIMYYPERLLELVLWYFIIWVLVIEIHLLVKIHWPLHRYFVHITCVTFQSNVYINREQKLHGQEENIFRNLLLRCHTQLSWKRYKNSPTSWRIQVQKIGVSLKCGLPCTSEISLLLFEHLAISGAPGARPEFIVL